MKEFTSGNIKLLNIDCMEYMRTVPDQYFDLAIVDPPYGIGIVESIKKTTKEGTKSMFKQMKGGEGANFDDCTPDGNYFNEIIRVTKNQIIWGGNYFLDYLGATRCFIVWDKMNGTNPMADAELAWASFSSSVRMFRMHHFSHGYGKKNTFLPKTSKTLRLALCKLRQARPENTRYAPWQRKQCNKRALFWCWRVCWY